MCICDVGRHEVLCIGNIECMGLVAPIHTERQTCMSTRSVEEALESTALMPAYGSRIRARLWSSC